MESKPCFGKISSKKYHVVEVLAFVGLQSFETLWTTSRWSRLFVIKNYKLIKTIFDREWVVEPLTINVV